MEIPDGPRANGRPDRIPSPSWHRRANDKVAADVRRRNTRPRISVKTSASSRRRLRSAIPCQWPCGQQGGFKIGARTSMSARSWLQTEFARTWLSTLQSPRYLNPPWVSSLVRNVVRLRALRADRVGEFLIFD